QRPALGPPHFVPRPPCDPVFISPIDHPVLVRLDVGQIGAGREHESFFWLMPVETLSAHWLAHPRFARAVEQFLEREGAGIARYVDELRDHSPFRQEEK